MIARWIAKLKRSELTTLIGFIVAIIGGAAALLDNVDKLRGRIGPAEVPAPVPEVVTGQRASESGPASGPTIFRMPTAATMRAALAAEVGAPVSELAMRAIDLDRDGRDDALLSTYRLRPEGGDYFPQFTDIHLFDRERGRLDNILHVEGAPETSVTGRPGAAYVVQWSHQGSGGYLYLDIFRHDPVGALRAVDWESGLDPNLEQLGLMHANPRVGADSILLPGARKSLLLRLEAAGVTAQVEPAVAVRVGSAMRRLVIEDGADSYGDGPPKVSFNDEAVPMIAKRDREGAFYVNASPLPLRVGEKIELAELSEKALYSVRNLSGTDNFIASRRGDASLDITINWYSRQKRLRLTFDVF